MGAAAPYTTRLTQQQLNAAATICYMDGRACAERTASQCRLDQEWARHTLEHGTQSFVLGSAVSPAWLAVSSPQTNIAACPWCTADPTFLGPTKNIPEDQVLQWLSHVQGLIWQERYS